MQYEEVYSIIILQQPLQEIVIHSICCQGNVYMFCCLRNIKERVVVVVLLLLNQSLAKRPLRSSELIHLP